MKNIPYGRHWIEEEDIRGVVGVLSSDWLTQGPKVREFEECLSSYAGAKYAVAVSSGTAALHLSMLALDIDKKDRVITSPITFSASANCILYVGANPVFVDIDDETYHIDMEKLKDLLKNPSLRKRIRAIIPVHFMGTVSDIAKIKGICDKYGIGIVEDAAHALGAKYREGLIWAKVGGCKHSDITIFSFHPIKHITTGEGGAVLTNNKKIYEAVLSLRHHGISRKLNFQPWHYDIARLGFNYRITDFQCALGVSQIKRLNKIVGIRRKLVGRYNKAFSSIKEIKLPHERENSYASYHLYVIRVPENKRDKLYSYLRENGIYSQINYIPVHLFSYYKKEFGFKPSNFPVAEQYFRECLSLPLYPTLTIGEQNRVISKIGGFFRHG